MKGLRKYFLTGIAIILPLVITFWFLKWLFLKIDDILFQPFLSAIKIYFKLPGLEILARLFVFVIFILAISFLGFLVSLFSFRRLWAKLENLILKFPFIGKVYNSIKQISSAIVGEGVSIFKKVVLVEYPVKGKFCIGFITAEAEELLNRASGEELVAVFIPTTPNPTSGMLIYFPKNSITILNLSIGDGMKLIISAGAVPTVSHDSEK